MAIWFPWCFLRSTAAPLQWQLCNVCDVWWLCHCQVHCALTRSCNSHATDPSLFPQWHLCQDLLETRNNLVTLETPNSPNIQRLNNFWNNWLKQVETLFHVVSSFKCFDDIIEWHWVSLNSFELLWTLVSFCLLGRSERQSAQQSCCLSSTRPLLRRLAEFREQSDHIVIYRDDMWWQLVWFVKSLPCSNASSAQIFSSSAMSHWSRRQRRATAASTSLVGNEANAVLWACRFTTHNNWKIVSPGELKCFCLGIQKTDWLSALHTSYSSFTWRKMPGIPAHEGGTFLSKNYSQDWKDCRRDQESRDRCRQLHWFALRVRLLRCNGQSPSAWDFSTVF